MIFRAKPITDVQVSGLLALSEFGPYMGDVVEPGPYYEGHNLHLRSPSNHPDPGSGAQALVLNIGDDFFGLKRSRVDNRCKNDLT